LPLIKDGMYYLIKDGIKAEENKFESLKIKKLSKK
jgi:hypothetical protein